ncbi:MAG: hypothetical protein ABS81_03140 [Pseudonocardia sp. SCN 72-86]|nr:MAG: hypothetical protein ABS81_03140 [Pseudonocardia sp. SCN 72-86]
MAPKTVSTDDATVVAGHRGTRYDCPDLAALDRHLVALTARIRQAAPQFPSLARAFRDDVDLLLDRRRWLELTT